MLDNGFVDIEVYFIKSAEDLDLVFSGSEEERREQFLVYIVSLIRPYAEQYGLNNGDWSEDELNEENLREYASFLCGEFADSRTLAEWCKRKGSSALLWLSASVSDNEYSLPAWSDN